ncbi:MAG: ATPase, T2SS/T4P/T4SS family [Candidatus Omnitrophica bacterium]|nr:ATPase, T2SS/T4P/T4SS family [Candidatus Omnitrophota bacterium]
MALRIGDILVEKKLITKEQLKIAINEQQKTGEFLGWILIKFKYITERTMLEALAEQQGIPFIDLKATKPTAEAIKTVKAKFVWHYKVVPVSLAGGVLTVAVSDPFDMWPIDDLEAHLGYKVEKGLSTSTDIAEAIKEYYGVGADTIETILAKEEKASGAAHAETAIKENVQDLEKLAGDASVIKLVNQILQQAIKDRATDIHIEHFRDDAVLRYRVDGILYDTQVSGNIKYLYPAIVSRIKVMSGLDIVERRLPQDGRAKVRIGVKEYELRVSVIPTLHGENIVIRILPTTMLFSISDLGMAPADEKILQELLGRPHGIIFVTGPTGSGKTTTLYASLSKLNTRERKIVTIEDPIEYELKGISQTQINSKIDLTFAAMLRSMLRHDPDVMMVGEVRDFETAEVTIQTALTGHLVFSTIHTNDAASGATRLIDIGIEPYLIASSVNAFIAQRLVRTICKNCKEPVKMKNDKFKAEGVTLGKEITVYRGKGCKACNNTGYMGRTGIYEILLVNEEIKKLIVQKTSSDVIKEKAAELGMHTLLQDGWTKILSGATTIEEIIRVIQLEGV